MDTNINGSGPMSYVLAFAGITMHSIANLFTNNFIADLAQFLSIVVLVMTITNFCLPGFFSFNKKKGTSIIKDTEEENDN